MDLEPRFSADEIREAVARIARAIEDDESKRHSAESVLLVGVLKGSFVFLADLMRELRTECEADFVRARSYGAGTTSTGEVQITKDLEADVRGRDVIVVEDIAETGLTMRAICAHIAAREPASLRTCALLVREGGPEPDDEPDYAGLRVGPGFLVGYGLDHAEQYRGLRDIHALPEEGPDT